jgi:hypothetical protein
VQRIAVTALFYFALVFGAGFLLGPIRILLLEPRLGPVAATLSEAPIMVAVTLFSAWWVPRLTGVRRNPVPLLLVGVIALALLEAADLAVGVLLRRMSATAVLSHFATPEGAIYAVLLILFAAMPLLMSWLLRGLRTE